MLPRLCHNLCQVGVYKHTFNALLLRPQHVQLASQPSSHPEYWVLLILTDGSVASALSAAVRLPVLL